MRFKFLAVFLFYVVCPGSVVAQASSFRVESTESGIPWARNEGDGAWLEADRWQASVGQRIGSVEGEGPDVFGKVWSLAASQSGRLYILDSQAQEIRVFHEGHHELTFGRRGNGPGEFRFADGITLDARGNVWVFDPPHARLHLFDPNGSLLRSIPRRVVGSVVPWPARVFGGTEMIDWFFARPGRDRSRPMVLGELDVYRPIRVELEAGEISEFPPLELRHELVDGIRVPLSAQIAFDVGPDRTIWFSHPTEYTFFRRNLEGDTTLVVSLEGLEGSEVTLSQRDSIALSLRSGAQQLGVSRRVPGRGDIPRRRPMIDRILTYGDDYLFVVPRLEDVPVGTVMDVFETETGRYLGRLALPVSLGRGVPVCIVPGHLYIVARDQWDVDHVVRVDVADGR